MSGYQRVCLLLYFSCGISHTAMSIATGAAGKRNASVPAIHGNMPVRGRSIITQGANRAAIALPQVFFFFIAMNTAPAATMIPVNRENSRIRSGSVTVATGYAGVYLDLAVALHTTIPVSPRPDFLWAGASDNHF